ncbi:beta-D-glucosyl crocetin beta-1,6-glucosyltransferase [Ranunculus cassubicifolius]
MDGIRKHYDLHVLMFPWLAHGHIYPFLELAKKLTQRNIFIYFCSTPALLSSIDKHIIPCSIRLVELHLPSLPNLPADRHTTKSLPLHLQPTLKTALDMSEPLFSDILSTFKPDLLIYDYIQPWAPQVAAAQNIPAIHFQTMGAAATSYLIHKFNPPTCETDFPFPNMYYYPEKELTKMSKFLASYSNNISNNDRFVLGIKRSSSIILIKTFGEIEAEYINYLSFLTGKEILPLGLLIQDPVNALNGKDQIIEWLDSKGKASTVFVSFGSEYFMSWEELSEVNFVWVIRFPDGDEASSITKVDQVLPQGFLERIGERGMIVEGWAPQMIILEHPSIGGFVTHCGWSSVLEGMKLGVPLIAMPMHIDQPLNARLIVELGVAVEVERDEDEKHGREEIANAIKQVMRNKQGHQDIKRRVEEISEHMARKGEEEMNLVVEKLMQLCNKTK